MVMGTSIISFLFYLFQLANSQLSRIERIENRFQLKVNATPPSNKASKAFAVW